MSANPTPSSPSAPVSVRCWEPDEPCSHTVQFYEDDGVLLDGLVRFVGSALGAGDAALIIATKAHREKLVERLETSGVNVFLASAQGRFLQLDAAETLSKFMVDRWPNEARFRATMEPTLQQLKVATKRKHPQASIFGEMVSLLCDEGKTEAALRLEQLWNDLVRSYSFQLRCGYPMRTFSHEGGGELLKYICAEHTSVVPAESYSSLKSEDERLRTVALLQQKAEALQIVVEERERLAVALADEIDDLRALHELSTRLSWLDLPHLMREVLSAVAALHKTNMGLLSLRNPDQDELQVGASLGLSEEFLRTIGHVVAGAGACGTCIQRGERVVVEDTETDPIFDGYRDASRLGGFRAVYSTPLLDRGGHLVGVLSVHFPRAHRPSERDMRLTDLYARMAGAAIDNARLSRALLQAEKLAATGRLAATIAHEINNPLESVVNLLYLLRSHVQEVPEARDYLAFAESELDRVAQITRQTLGFYRERLAPEPVSLPELLDSVLSVFAKQIAQKRIMIVRRDPPCSVVGVKGELRQLFSNLLDNAIAAVPESGRIDVSVSHDGTAAIISITDNGTGIRREHLSRLFEPFFTTKEHLGTGLGLWVAKEIAEKHGGDITAESSTDPMQHGSTFRVRIVGMPEQQTERVEAKGSGQPAPAA